MPEQRGEEVFDLIKVRKNEIDFTSPLQKNFAGRLDGDIDRGTLKDNFSKYDVFSVES